MTKHELTQQIKQKALELGFTDVGIIPAQAFKDEEFNYLENWLKQGHHADMDWMTNNLDIRKNPTSDKLLPDAKSIVCLTINYFNENSPPEETALKIAKYARGKDYHKVIKKRLKQLLKEVQKLEPGINGRGLTDSAPMLERPLAVKSGLGWVGKNGNLISKRHGSFIFLAQLVLDTELDYDIPSTRFNHCGTCTRCIDSCPTDAIIRDATIDANKCIAYWTIENRTEDHFPEEIKHNLNGWIFGCDICQDVCPWNIKFAKPTRDDELKALPHNELVDKEAILNMREDEFSEIYQNSPVKRTGLNNLQRNIQEAQK